MRATEAQNLLLGCLRFVARNSDGTPNPDGKPVPYNKHFDDRNPIGFEFPPDKTFSSGPNQVWNTLATLPHADSDLTFATRRADAAIDRLRALLHAADADAYRLAVVAAIEWLTADATEDDE